MDEYHDVLFNFARKDEISAVNFTGTQFVSPFEEVVSFVGIRFNEVCEICTVAKKVLSDGLQKNMFVVCKFDFFRSYPSLLKETNQ